MTRVTQDEGDSASPAATCAVPPPKRVMGLDLLRTVAVLLVLISHYWKNVAAWYGFTPPASVPFIGSLGVDLFFALSGFLIGRILIGVASERPSWRGLLVFLVRRWLRTLPVYVTWLGVLAVFFPPAGHLGSYLVRFGTLTQNLWRPMPSDWWFAVSWSLAVEEWFYLLFGAAVILGAMRFRAVTAVWLPLMVMLVVPVALRLSVGSATFSSDGYSLMVPFRLDDIGYGVILAWLDRRPSRLHEHTGALLAGGLCLVFAAWGLMAAPGVHLIAAFRNTVAVAGCTLCIPASLRLREAPSWIAWLSHHGSRLSYAIYIVHATFLVSMAQHLVNIGRVTAGEGMVVAVLGTFVVAEVMSRCVEQPFMKLRPSQGSRDTLRPSAESGEGPWASEDRPLPALKVK